MTFTGIDPVGLGDLGRRLEYRADTIASAVDRATNPLERHGRGSSADRIGTRLTGTAAVLRDFAADFGWRIDAVLARDDLRPMLISPDQVPISLVAMAVALPPGVGPGRFSISRSDVLELEGMTPAEVAAYFAGRSEAEIGLLVATHPQLLTDLDGAPPWARYAASDLLIAQRIAALQEQADVVRDQLGRGLWFEELVLTAHLEAISGEVAELEKWLGEDRQILLFDPSGDGRVVEVFGDLVSSTNIGVVVPGITNDRANFSEADGGFRANARNIHDRAIELGIDDVATIAWLGYDTPDGADAIFKTAAKDGRGDLIDFVAGMDALEGYRHIAVIGHSYGSLVTGMAAKIGLAANEVVFVGSPGTSLNNADEAKLKPGGVVWAGLAAGDPIGAGVDITEFLTPQDQLKQTVRRLLDSLGGEDNIRDLHHGTNPAHEDFGAIEIHTDGSSGHSAYFKPDTVTLDNLLYIIAGMDGAVSIEIPAEIEIAPGPIGEPWYPPEPTGEVA